MFGSILFRRGAVAMKPATRTFKTTAIRRNADPLIGHIEQEAQAGSNLPFSIQNRYKLAALFIVYFGSGFSAPFLIVRNQLLKK